MVELFQRPAAADNYHRYDDAGNGIISVGDVNYAGHFF